VLADLVGEARDRVTLGPDARARIEQVAPGVLGETDGATSGPLADHVLTLDRGHRFDERSAVAEVADAIRHGDADRVIAELAVGREGLSWVDPGERTLDRLHEVLVPAIEHARALIELASAGMVDEALERLSDLALLCAHREGPVGVSDWVQLIEQRTRTTPGWTGVWYPGRPVMVRANDYRLRLFNGDIGVTVAVDGTLQVAFPDASGARLVGPGPVVGDRGRPGDDDPQEPGLSVPPGDHPRPRPGLPPPHPRTALHGSHESRTTRHRRRLRGGHPRRREPPGDAGVRAARAVVESPLMSVALHRR
jgi:hypothetical protein